MIELMDREQRRRLLPFYEGTSDALLLAGLQGHMGRAFLSHDGQSALIMVQGFIFLAGRENGDFFRQAMAGDPGGFLTFSGSDAWRTIAAGWGADISMTRFALDTPAAFDRQRLKNLAAAPAGFSLKRADEALYRACLALPWCNDCVSAFPDYESFSQNGLAVMALKEGQIVAVCGAYAFSDGQWEVEIDTHPLFRRRGLATACGARFILACLEMNRLPHWDAMTPVSLALARKLGFQNPRPYPVVCREGE